MKKKRLYAIAGCIAVLTIGTVYYLKNYNFNSSYTTGQVVDQFNGVNVYYNGGVDNVSGRNLTADNYNLGLKYQCVEFVKRYYCEHLDHKMPDSYGHAKDFFDPEIPDGRFNTKRALLQYHNPSESKPKVNDLLVYSGSLLNRFGHVAIVSEVHDNEIEIIQQNPGPFAASRARFSLQLRNDMWVIDNKRIIGWLRKE